VSGRLRAFFEPRSVAVIGASRDPGKVGGSVLANLLAAGFPGRVIPVNPAADRVQGLPAVPSILAVTEPVDLAVIAVPAPTVLDVLKACAAQGVAGAVILSAGFREAGPAGQAREAELRAWLRDQRLRVLGPNCLGWIRPRQRLNATFAPGMPEPGGIAFISHSGALAVAILDWSRERRMGFSLFASLGNQADLTETDLVEVAGQDPETRVIVVYLEGVAEGRRFVEVLGAAAAVKPVVVLKAGRSAEGARAVASHTGALAGSDAAFDAALRRAGAVRLTTIEELFDVAQALDTQPLPRGARVAIVTNGGGLGVVAADAVREAGLVLEPLDPETRNRLRAVLPATASVANPVDLVGDADAARYSRALHALGPGAADSLLVLLTAQATTDAASVARAIGGATRGWPTPVLAAFVGGARVRPGVRTLEDAGIPCYSFPERAVRALAGLVRVVERRQERRMPRCPPSPPAEAVAWAAEVLRGSRRRLGLPDLTGLLAAYGIPVLAGRLVHSVDEAVEAAVSLGFPVALKLVSPDIVHKSDVGGVRLDLGDAQAVRSAGQAILGRAAAERPEARVEGLFVQPMAPRGHELLLGGLQDPQFGALVAVGFGGVYVEVLRDTTSRLAPVEPAEALAMVDELRLAPLLRGVRGGPPADRERLAGAVSRFSVLVSQWPMLVEVEINPLVAGPGGAVAVDARATLRAAGEPPAAGA
jgi:acetyl coenzyme A synthetase (ADP forming)-like protein